MYNRFKPIICFLLFASISLAQSIEIEPLSVRSIYLETFFNSQPLARATGFIVENDNKPYLITNWHVVTGINPSTGDTVDTLKRIPNILLIYHHSTILGTWLGKAEYLYNNSGNKRWLEHPDSSKVDVIAFPLDTSDQNIHMYFFDLDLANTNMIPEVAMPVQIIGYPAGLAGKGNFPIWKTGNIASEPNLNYNNEPVFLIDATTRGGMSGSPVILRLKGGYRELDGGRIMSSTYFSTLFLGVYSGQWQYPEIGKVWKPIVINEIFNNQ